MAKKSIPKPPRRGEARERAVAAPQVITLGKPELDDFYNRAWDESEAHISPSFRFHMAKVDRTLAACHTIAVLLRRDHSHLDLANGADVEYLPLDDGMKAGLDEAMCLLLESAAEIMEELREVKAVQP